MDDDSRTIWCGNLSDKVTEELLYELFLQAGPLAHVKIAKDKSGNPRSFGFITYHHELSVPYALNLFEGTTLFNRVLHLQARSSSLPVQPPPQSYSSGRLQNEIPRHLRDIRNEFLEMTKRMDNEPPLLYNERHDKQPDLLSVASLQGNWSHRHHPYQKNDSRHQGTRSREDNNRGSNSKYDDHRTSSRDYSRSQRSSRHNDRDHNSRRQFSYRR